ncbi:39S ribosomal protein L38, mitochondrial isoform X2 [Venturia canescens]|uniref:39S ribosomal protein L38, mitochondrial isoform X2 n=1 Tax=Venturia canescens TaxID=32260 RepID=UPI001C9C1518|nr:39S ribosomal protein L38, mitochondrial isoform X2 [Venturia canescens]
MSSQFYRRICGDLIKMRDQQVRLAHTLRGKAPGIARTLEDRFAEINWKDPELHFRVDIGFKHVLPSRNKIMSQWIDQMKTLRHDPDLEKKARGRELYIDLEKSKEEWWQLSGPSQILMIADHYEIFQHLFGDAYFMPVVPLNINYSQSQDSYIPVHRGNLMKARDVAIEPSVTYDVDKNTLWTLLLTTPDGNFVDSSKEICHWFVGNIPGSEISKGDLLMEYARPIPAKGIGYCRYIFILYKQENNIDYSEYKREQQSRFQLLERNWSTVDFYRKYEDVITPASLAFFQADWDSSLTDYYRNVLETREPNYEYEFPEPHLRKEEWFPKGKPFNLYLDKYRDPKEINKEFLLKKMKKIHPFRAPIAPLRFPNAVAHPKDMPSWLSLETKKERLGWGRINEIA